VAREWRSAYGDVLISLMQPSLTRWCATAVLARWKGAEVLGQGDVKGWPAKGEVGQGGNNGEGTLVARKV
jgi:hypothetical protein